MTRAFRLPIAILFGLWATTIWAVPARPFIDGGGGGSSNPTPEQKRKWEQEAREAHERQRKFEEEQTRSLGYAVPRNEEIVRCDTHADKRKLFDDFLAEFKKRERASSRGDWKSLQARQNELKQLVMRMWPPECFDKYFTKSRESRSGSLFWELCPKLQQALPRWGTGPHFASHNVGVTDQFLISEREDEDYGEHIWRGPKWNGANEAVFLQGYDRDSLNGVWYVRTKYSYGTYELNGVMEDTDRDGFVDKVTIYKKFALNKDGLAWESRPWKTFDLKDKAVQKQLGLDALLERPRTEQCGTLMGDPSKLFKQILDHAKIDINHDGAEYSEYKDYTPPTKPACPHVIIDQIADNDKDYGLFAWYTGKTVEDFCRNILSSAHDAMPSEIEKTLYENKSTRIEGVGPHMMSDCIKARNANVDTDGDGRAAKSALYLDDEKALIGDYTWSMLNISEHAKATVEEVAAIDNILGLSGEQMLKVEAGEVLADPLLPGTEQWASDVKKLCKPSSELPSNDLDKPVNVFGDMMAKSRVALDAVVKIRDEMASLTYYPPAMGPGAVPHPVIRNPKRYQELKNAEKVVLSQASWLNGEHMNKLLGRTSAQVSENELRSALVDQLKENRQQLLYRQKRLLAASKCINGSFKDSCVEEFRKTLSSLPMIETKQYLSTDWRKIGKEKAKENGVAKSFLDGGACRFGVREAKAGFDEAVAEFRNNVILTVATAGIGSALSAGRTGVMLARTGAAATEVGEAVNAGAQTVKAASALKTLFLSTAPDLAWAAVDSADAFKKCQEAAESKLGNMEIPLAQQSSPSCARASASLLYTQSSYSTCLMHAAMVAVDLLPALPGVAAAVKNAGRAAPRLIEHGMAREVAESVGRQIAESPTLRQQESRILGVMEQLPRDFAKNKKDAQELVRFLSELDKLHGGALKPHETAQLIKNLDKPGVQALGALTEDAAKILKASRADASMTAQRALEQALKERKGLSPDTIRAVLECATAIGAK